MAPSLRSPLPQLLVAHVRFTIAINTKAREQLICEYGLFDKVHTPVCLGPHGPRRQLSSPSSEDLGVFRSPLWWAGACHP